MIVPDAWTESAGVLKVSGQAKLDANGNGAIYFSTPSGHQRWEVTGVVFGTNQPANATVVPVGTVALNAADISTMSPGNNLGATWSGNQDVGRGNIDVGPCDFLTVLFSPPPGSTPAQVALLAGVICTAVISGTKFTRTG